MQHRNTVQKNLVLHAVSELGNHATADEVYQFVKAEAPSVSRGTVYRNLNILAGDHEIQKIEVPGEADRFDHQTFDHYHVRCIQCGRVSDVDMDVIPDMIGHIRNPHGFVFLECEVTFKGICPNCNSTPGIGLRKSSD